MSEGIKENVTRRSIWLRLFFMIVLSLAFNVAELVTFAVVVFQFFASLFTGRPNDQLVGFGRNLARYLQQIIVFMTFVTEEKPFPFAPWPNEPAPAAPVAKARKPRKVRSKSAGDAPEASKTGKATKADNTDANEKPEDTDKPQT